MVHTKNNRRLYLVLFIGIFLFAEAFLLSFWMYRQKLIGEFDRLIEDNLAAYTESQKQEVLSYIEGVRSSTKHIAFMLETMDEEPEEEQIQKYLDKIGVKQGFYQFTYASLEALEQYQSPQGQNEETEKTLQHLREGQDIVSNVRWSERFQGNYFSIATPVQRDGKTVGMVRSVIPAEELIRTSQVGYLRGSITSYVVKSNGDFVVLRDKSNTTENLFTREELAHKSQSSILRRNLTGNGCMTDRFQADGKTIFVSSSNLQYNDWNLINFANADEVTDYSQNILRYTVIMSIGISLSTAALLFVVFWTIGHQQRKLRLSQMRYELLSRFSDTLLMEYHIHTDTIHWSENALDAFALKKISLKRCSEEINSLVHPEDMPVMNKLLHDHLPEGEICCYEIRMQGKDNKYHWFSCQSQTLYDGDNPEITVCKLSDITEHKAREQHLQAKADADTLTGLLNAGALREQVQSFLQQGGQGFFFMLDIDDFKGINDSYGHPAGDAALNGVAETLRKTFRVPDPAGRLGGDEFAVFMCGKCCIQTAEEKASALLTQIGQIRITQAPSLRLSASIGVAGTCNGYSNLENLLSAADKAMYIAKRQGKNAYYVLKEKDDCVR